MRLAPLRLLSICLFLTSPLYAQNFGADLFKLDPSSQKAEDGKAKVSAALLPTDQDGVVRLAVKLEIPPGANTYSQSPDFAKPTKFKVTAPGWTALDKDFTPDHPAKREFDKNFNKEVEKFTGTVIFERRYLAPAGVDVSGANLSGEVNFLICKEFCVPQTELFTAVYDASGTFIPQANPQASEDLGPPPVMDLEGPPNLLDALAAPPEQVDPPELISPPTLGLEKLAYGYVVTPTRNVQGVEVKDPLTLQFELSPQPIADDMVTLAITMIIEENWSTYALEKASENQIEMPTEVKLELDNLKSVGELTAVQTPEVHENTLAGQVSLTNAHTKQVTWKQDFKLVNQAPYGISGTIRYQICETEKSCLRPLTIPFSLGTVQSVVSLVGASAPPTSFISNVVDDTDLFSAPPADEIQTLGSALWSAFLVGLILNIMPCILPVLAIKILSFVQQSGESRSRAILLNFSYTAGVIAVFMALALITVILKSSLSGMFQNTTFMIVMAGVIFTMALSLFGVFELPVPGILPSANDHQEGYIGAFSTGIVATILGTPCIGPFIAPVMVFCIQQTAPTVFLVFAVMGIGMASPFLLTALFPALINWLPKPGMWMVKFKQFSGFLMMGTVIFLMFSIEMEWRLPVLFMFLAISLCVWMMANLVNYNASSTKKNLTYALSLLVSAPVFMFGLWQMKQFTPVNSQAVAIATDSVAPVNEHGKELPWQPFSEEQLVSLRKAGKPMLVDFTANWCAICKWNEAFALNTKPTVEFVEEHGIVTMMADFTKESPEIRKWLDHFGQPSVPLTIIIPAGAGSEIIALRGQYSQAQLLEELKKAVGASESQTVQVSAQAQE